MSICFSGSLPAYSGIQLLLSGVPENRTSPHITAHQPHITPHITTHQPHITRNQDIEA